MAEKEKNENVEETKEVKENNELQQKQQELDDLTDRYKRILAEFENHKKRSQKEREGLYNSILGDVVEVMLPILLVYNYPLYSLKFLPELMVLTIYNHFHL